MQRLDIRSEAHSPVIRKKDVFAVFSNFGCFFSCLVLIWLDVLGRPFCSRLQSFHLKIFVSCTYHTPFNLFGTMNLTAFPGICRANHGATTPPPTR